ncbi:hypothetical protein AVEN_108879-1 [Araneus ventricosus]|uniref:Uncharacterized protein n=1 Tax=Araneus ventricosus TaxID=182803 RepID=A0A4Y2L5F0_ARAVE|nr:hypothetical protein AVEN_192628-1 [Araneus ventricosus]GBN09895.1 hypothetical protein AVEN_250931-1 [Araneus ventricosus]GBN09918.1 hypothetical protein AVEN_44727-1 [Araneus ventricosus]GBN09978.1 hypothetical protein AVEN_108879-1 [Araneus ventricosus]
MSRFEITRGLFWDEPRNFEPRPNEKVDTRSWHPLSKLLHQTNGKTLPCERFQVPQIHINGRYSGESGLELEPFSLEAEILLICRQIVKKRPLAFHRLNSENKL